MLVVSHNISVIESVKELLKLEFDMQDLGTARRILGITIFRNRSKLEMKLSQAFYVKKVLSKFSMENSKVASVRWSL